MAADIQLLRLCCRLLFLVCIALHIVGGGSNFAALQRAACGGGGGGLLGGEAVRVERGADPGHVHAYGGSGATWHVSLWCPGSVDDIGRGAWAEVGGSTDDQLCALRVGD